MTPLTEQVRLLVQEYLSGNDEDACWLRGAKGSDWHAAYVRLVNHVSNSLIKSMGWLPFLEVRMQVIKEIRWLLK